VVKAVEFVETDSKSSVHFGAKAEEKKKETSGTSGSH